MRRLSWFLFAILALGSGCSGGQMLIKGNAAPAFPAGVHMLNGAAPSLATLTARGPLVLVLIRGFS